ncbi:hypothetical protein Rhopal_003543-T1 [Rhodotorula paludigena]|uniref:Manganese/iron superoxide dismutase C-terminal domain-containing protein n=1 Tax=Rhodotorula paludigena TaxID=86838 RepID=A0AAV5GNE8_9BASI|nr:hypothetical protein Rhopal_003543-T1 [Rhodotorula paludigena]
MASLRASAASARRAVASSSSSAAASAPAAARRQLHSRVPLAYSPDHGIPGFLSPAALRTVAVDWQQGVLDRLNDLVRGSDLESLSVLQTVKQAAQDPTKTLAFNYASEALNNSFFLSTLSPTPSSPNPSSNFSRKLATIPSLGSFPALVSHLSAHVAGLHPSSGAYVWLVTDPSGNLGVVGTYAGGTVLVKERYQMGYGAYAGKDLKVLGEEVPAAVDAGAEGAGAAGAGGGAPQGQQQDKKPESAWQTVSPQQKQRGAAAAADASLLSEGTLSASAIYSSVTPHAAARIGQSLHPLACISTHPHCYLADYGLWGRDEYVKKWWGAVDWAKIEDAYDGFRRNTRV